MVQRQSKLTEEVCSIARQLNSMDLQQQSQHKKMKSMVEDISDTVSTKLKTMEEAISEVSHF